MVKAAVILVGSLIVGAACATADRPPVVYDKPGVSEADRKRDESECAKASVGAPRPEVTLGAVSVNRELYDACMKGRGYTARASSS